MIQKCYQSVSQALFASFHYFLCLRNANASILNKKHLEITKDSEELWNRYYLTRWNPHRTMSEGDKIISEDEESAKILNKFFSSILKPKNWRIAETDLSARNITHPILKPMIQHRKRPSILAIINKMIDKDLIFESYSSRYFNPLSANPQNVQTHSKNSSATADDRFERVWSFCGVGA